MTTDQADKVSRLSQCRFLPGSYDKRFVGNLAATPERELTTAQATYLEKVWHRYRRQIPGHEATCTICKIVSTETKETNYG